MAKEFLDSSARINNTEKNTGRQGGKLSLGRFALRLLGSAGLMVSPLIVACAPDAKAVPPEATATFVPGGFGGPNPIATYPSFYPEAESLNKIIDRINKSDPTLTNDERNAVTLAGSADRTATVVGGTKPPVEGTQTPSQTEAPKGFDCGILSPEACATAELIELPPNAEGQSLRYVGLNPPAGTELLMPINGQVVKDENPKGFNGFRAGIFQTSNLRFAYSVTGDIGFKNKLTENKDSGQTFAVVQETGIKNYGYSVLITASEFNDKDQTITADRILQELFPQLYTKGRSPKKVTAQIPSNSGPTKSSPIFLPRN